MGLTVAWIDPGQVLGSFCQDLVGLTVTGSLNRVITGWIRLEHGPSMDLARNQITQQFLDTEAEWLLQLDTDMGFPPDLASRLLASADPDTRPIVGGLCFGMSKAQGVFPTAYLLKDGRYWIVNQLPDELFQVDGTGAAVLLIHRSVFDRITGTEWPGRWWDRLYLGGNPVGEDLSFCLRCKAAGVPVWIDPTVPILHHKLRVPITRGMWENQKGKECL
jgi:hypothetical protein